MSSGEAPTSLPALGPSNGGALAALALPFLLLGAVLLGVGTGTARAQQPAEPLGSTSGPGEKQTLGIVVPVRGPLSVTTTALVQRALRAADGSGVSHVILRIDSEGGLIQIMREVEGLLAAIRESGARTVAFVEGKAWSAGAYLALACDVTYMAPGASIGAITPVLAGGQDIPESDIRSKMFAAIKGRVRGMLEARGGFSEDARRLAEGMVDRRVQLYRVTFQDASGIQKQGIRDADELRSMELDQSLRILDQQAYSTPVVLTAAEALEPPVSLSSGTYSSLDELVREELSLSMTTVEEYAPSWSESAVAWIDGLKWVLFALGFVLILVELKSPGFAVPGALGILLLGTAMFGSYMTGLAEWTEILLFFLGLVAIAVEIFVLPGTMVFGIIGFLSMIAALLLSRQSFLLPGDEVEQDILFYNLLHITSMLLATIGLTAVTWRMLPKVPMFNRLLLAPPDPRPEGVGSGASGEGRMARMRGFLGRETVTSTPLRPTGVVELDGERIDVVSDGDFIDAGVPVRIIAIESYRVVVERVGPEGGQS